MNQEDVKLSMAKQNDGKRTDLTQRTTLTIVKSLLSNEENRARFNEILKERAPQFLASLTSLIASRTDFDGVDAKSIIGAAIIAATFDLPINPSLGYAHLVPYRDNTKGYKVCQFQMGWKGYKQLAIRTGQYLFIHTSDIREGEFKRKNRLTGQVEFDFIESDAEREKKPIVGYFNYFKLSTGYESTLYMSMDELMAHAKKYSKSYQYDLKQNKKSSKWSIDEERPFMCTKTVTKLNLSTNGILSVELKRAFEVDQAEIQEDLDGDKINYPDGTDQGSGEPPVTEETEIIGKEENPPEDFELFQNPQYWIGEMNKIDNKTHWTNWKKKHLQDLSVFEGDDKVKIDEIFAAKEKEFKK